MNIILLSGDLFVYDARRRQARYVPRNDRPESGSCAITLPDAVLRHPIPANFLGELRKLPEANLDLAASIESDSFALFIHQPPDFEELDEKIAFSITAGLQIVNRSGIAILTWILGFFVRQNVTPEASAQEIVWTVALSPQTRAKSRGRR